MAWWRRPAFFSHVPWVCLGRFLSAPRPRCGRASPPSVRAPGSARLLPTRAAAEQTVCNSALALTEATRRWSAAHGAPQFILAESGHPLQAWRHHSTRVRLATRERRLTPGAGTRRPQCPHPFLTGMAQRPIWRRAPSALQGRKALAKTQRRRLHGARSRLTKGGHGVTARPRLLQSGQRPGLAIKHTKGYGARQRGVGPNQAGSKPARMVDGTNPRLAHHTLLAGARCPGGLRQPGELLIP